MQISKINCNSGANFQGRLTITNSRKGRVKVFETTPNEDRYLERAFKESFIEPSCHGWVQDKDFETYEGALLDKYGMNLPAHYDEIERPVEAYKPEEFYILSIPGVYKIKHELYNNRVYRNEYGDYYTEHVSDNN